MGNEKHLGSGFVPVQGDHRGNNAGAERNSGGGSVAGIAVLAVLALVLTAQPAAAQLKVCNQSNETISLAVAYYDVGQPQGQLTSRGWYVANPGECPTVVGGPLRVRYYYLRGNGTTGTTWGSAVPLCTAGDRFSYVGTADCERSGFRTENFLTVDTGSSTAMTFTLTGARTPVADTGGRQGVAELQVSWRYSTLEDGTMVMRIHNNRPTTVDLQLKCFVRGGGSKVLPVSVAGKSISEVGFMQGWPGNFVTGERCEAYYGSELVWNADVPAR